MLDASPLLLPLLLAALVLVRGRLPVEPLVNVGVVEASSDAFKVEREVGGDEGADLERAEWEGVSGGGDGLGG